MPMWSYYDAGGMAWWMMVLAALVWLALAALAIWVVVPWLIRVTQRPTPQPPQAPSHPSALDVLKARYARHEIDTATFQAMRAQLDESAPSTAAQAKEPVSSGR